MKQVKLKGLSAALAAVMMLPTFAAAADAQTEKDDIYYEYRFNADSDTDIFEGAESTFTIEDGICKIVTARPKGSARTVTAAVSAGKPLHKVAEGERDTLEVKVKFDKPTIKYLFAGRDSSADTENVSSAALKYKDTTGTVLLDLNGAAMGDAQMLPSQWQQLFFVFDNDTYELYINGKKATIQPIALKNTKTDEVEIKQLDKFLFMGNKNTTVDQTTWVDDIISRKLVPIYLENSSIEDNAVNVPTDTAKVTLDFNTVADSTSLSNLHITAGGRELSESEYTAAINSSDATMVDITFCGELSGSTEYTVDYSGVCDLINSEDANTANGSISFTTEEKETPFEINSCDASDNTATDTAVTVIFNKALGLEFEKFVKVTPETEVNTAADGNRLVITPKYNWLANKNYSISFSGATASDGSIISEDKANISFATIENPYADAAVKGDFSWYNGKVNAAAAQKTGICALEYSKIEKITALNGKNDLPFIYRTALGSGDDKISGNMLILGGGHAEKCIIYETRGGLGTFVLNTAEKITSDMGSIEIYTATDGSDYTDPTAFTLAEYEKSGELTTLWNNGVTYTVTANDPNIKYVKVVVKKAEGSEAKTAYSPALCGAEMSPYIPKTVAAYKAENKSYNTADITFDGLLDKASVCADAFKADKNNILTAEIAESSDAYHQTVRLTLENELKDGEVYSVAASGLKDIFGNAAADGSVSFTAENAPVKFSDVNDADGKITGVIMVPLGSRFEGKSAVLITAYYDNGKFSSAETQAVSLNRGENAFEIQKSDAEKSTVLMLWESFGSMMPVGSSYIVD